MKWLVDNQLPHQLCTALKQRGHNAVHVSELKRSSRTPDGEVCAVADEQGFVVVSKDEDFVHSHITGKSPKMLVFVSTGNIRNSALIFLFMHCLEELCTAVEEGHMVELTRTGLIVR